jgi:hypothetical protein
MSTVRAAFADAGYAYRKVFGSWGRIVRYAGLPAVAVLALALPLLAADPEAWAEGMRSAWPAILPLAVLVSFAYALFFQRWARFELSGEDGPRFLSFPVRDDRVWTLMAAFLVLGFAAAAAGSVVIAPVLMLVEAATPDRSVTRGLMLLTTALLLGFLLLIVTVRLMIGLVPTALGQPTRIRAAFSATAGRMVYFAALCACVYVPQLVAEQVATTLLSFAGAPPGFALLGGDLATVPFMAVPAVLAAGLFRDVVQPWRAANGEAA